MKRLIFSLIAAAICAAVCFLGRSVLIPNISTADLVISAIGNRLLIGIVIGISSLRVNFLLHGAIIGFIVTLSYSIGMLVNQNYFGFMLYTGIGILFGLFIEFFVTKICKQANFESVPRK